MYLVHQCVYEEARDDILDSDHRYDSMWWRDEKAMCSAVSVIVKKEECKVKNIQWNNTFQKLLAHEITLDAERLYN